VVKQWCKKENSPLSTLCRTSDGFHRELLKKISSGFVNIEIWSEDMKGDPAMINHTNSMNLYMLGTSA